MELWATGFNAWGQLNFDESVPIESPDLPSFTLILEDGEIEVRALYEAATLVNVSTGMKVAGDPTQFLELFSLLGDEKDMFWPIAIAGNQKMSAITSGYIRQFDSLFGSCEEDNSLGPGTENFCRIFQDFDELVTEVVANSTAFTALTSVGTVYTWGDGRLYECLGRQVSSESPAEKPCIVDDLFSLPDRVIRISSGGHLTAALTSGNDIYIWGTGVAAGPLDRLWSSTPFPLDLVGQDFLDVAIGHQHVVVLTTEHKIFVMGANESGQLGLSDKRDYTEWTEVTVVLQEQQWVTRVYAGHRNSFLLVETKTE